jgi:Protein of unknown function (DUF2894)
MNNTPSTVSNSEEAPPSEQPLAARLGSLGEQGLQQFAPRRFHYLQSLLNAAGQQSPVVTQRLVAKAAQGIDALWEDYQICRDQAAVEFEQALALHGDLVAPLRSLLEAGDLRTLRRQLKAINRNAGDSPLRLLKEKLDQGYQTLEDNLQDASFADHLRKQERDMLLSLGNTGATESSDRSGELKSARRFRDTLVKVNADRLVKQSVEDAPEDSGPLNPQRLMIRSLSTMRDLSPHYLSQFVSYVDTLFWLEQVADD